MTTVDAQLLPAPAGTGRVSPAVIGVAAGAAALGGCVAGDAVRDLWHLGLTDAESSHVLLVPVVFAWLAAVRLGRLRACDGRGRWPGAALVVAGVALWAMGYRYQVQAFWHGGAVVLMTGSALLVLGRDVLWKFLPAFGALVFLVPVPARVRLHWSAPLERVTAELTQSVGEALGMEVGRAGNQLSTNGVAVCVAEACNGMRMAFTLMLAGYLAMFYRPLRWWVRAAVLLAIPAVSVAANVARLVPTVWVFGHYPPEAAERFHDVAGWVMLVVAFAVLTGACRLLAWVGVSVDGPPFAAAGPGGGASGAAGAASRVTAAVDVGRPANRGARERELVEV